MLASPSACPDNHQNDIILGSRQGFQCTTDPPEGTFQTFIILTNEHISRLNYSEIERKINDKAWVKLGQRFETEEETNLNESSFEEKEASGSEEEDESFDDIDEEISDDDLPSTLLAKDGSNEENIAGNIPGSGENESDPRGHKEAQLLQSRILLEQDVKTGGLHKWFPLLKSSSLIDSFVELVKAQVDLELTGGGKGGNVKTMEQYLPINRTWFSLLSAMSMVADKMVPAQIVPPQIKDIYVGVSSPFARFAPWNTVYKSGFFHSAKTVFSYFTRMLRDEDFGVWWSTQTWNGIQKGFTNCLRRTGPESGIQFKITRNTLPNCEKAVEMESVNFTKSVLDESFDNRVVQNVFINYTATHIHPNKYLPPLAARISSKRWIFIELMWYAVQLSYAFCFQSFAQNNPDGFMLAFSKILEVFESKVVQNIWTAPEAEKLGIFESMLPYFEHSAFAQASQLPIDDDIHKTLNHLDMVLWVVHEASLVNRWMARPNTKKNRKGHVPDPFLNLKRNRRSIKEGDSPNSETGKGTILIWNGLALCHFRIPEKNGKEEVQEPSVGELKNIGIACN